MSRVLILLFLFSTGNFAIPLSAKQPENTGEIKVRIPEDPESKINSYLDKEAFQYVPPQEGFQLPGNFVIREWMIWTVATLGVLILLIYIFRIPLRGMVTGGAGEDWVRPASYDRELHEKDDPDELIRNALSQGDYRMALRYQYLKMLRELAKKDLVRLEKSKTNGDYLREIGNTTFQALFQELTRVFEYFWYGHFEMDEQEYDHASTRFEHFHQKIRRGK